MFILDTDHLSIIDRRQPPFFDNILARQHRVASSDDFVTLVSIHEQMMGANAFLSRSLSAAKVVRGYQMMEAALVQFERYNILPFDEPTALKLEQLRQQKVRFGTMDLRIASIALSHDFTVVTRNTVDYEKVPDLKVADWTLPVA